MRDLVGDLRAAATRVLRPSGDARLEEGVVDDQREAWDDVTFPPRCIHADNGGMPATLDWDGTALVVVDQTLLPAQVRLVRLASVGQVVDAIRRLVVRGAPVIGAVAAYGLAGHPHTPEMAKALTQLGGRPASVVPPSSTLAMP